MESRLSGRDIGFDAPTSDDDDHAPPSPAAYLRTSDEDPSEAYERMDSEDHQLRLLREGMSRLDDRSRDIVKRRWLDDDNKVTLQELADEYGVSAERTRQVEANALTKLKALLDRKSDGSGKSVSVRVDLGGRRIIKKKNKEY